MSAPTLEALLAGAVCGAGILLLAGALVGRPVVTSAAARPALISSLDPSKLGIQLIAAVGSGIVVLALTGWLVAAIAAALAGFFWRSLFGGAREARAEMQRLEELAAWTESLRDTIAGAVGLEQAIPATLQAVGSALYRPLSLLVDRLRSREPLPDALLRFADDLHDPSADLIVAALVLNARLRGPGLRDVLTSLSAAAREELDMRGRIEAQRRSTRRSVKIIVGIAIVFVLGLAVLSPAYVAPYGSFVGEVMLVVVFGLFAAGLLWLRGLAAYEMPERFLTGQGRGDGR